MKKTVLFLAGLLLFLNSFQLVATIFFSFLGYNFEFKFSTLLAIIIGQLTALFTIFILTHKDLKEIIFLKISLSILTPLSIINTAVHIIALNKFNLPIAICLFGSTVCLCLLTILCVKPLGLKIATLVLSGILIGPVALWGFFTIADLSFGEDRVIKSLESPKGTYYAEVISSDQGALGGDTIVKVHSFEEIDNLFFRINKKAQTVYFGEWYEYEDIGVYWKDDNTLIVKQKEYQIE
ncbi:MAG: hypothetical protein IKB72_03190 [Ruminococcus sp.]|nr:hypothetical protein [Oscillospiraceae bacterium]MBR2724424.1 hypothetical protein [Ruminococcus sp.]